MNPAWSPKLPRRSFLAAGSLLAGALALGQRALADTPTPRPEIPAPADPTRTQGLPLSAIGIRSPFVRLARIFTPGPQLTAGGSFTPLQDLSGIITPSDLHFQRNHAGTTIIDPAKHRLLIHGLVDRPTVYTVDEIKRFPAISRIYFLECSGNSFGGWTSPASSSTAQSLHGLTSTSEWTGVPVSTLMKEVGVQSTATWALAEAADGAVMDRSIPTEKLLDDALVVYAQNGEPLRPEQGFPLRLLLPGWEGNMNIKWLRRLKFGSGPFETREETSKYTDPLETGVARQFTFEMEAKSLITWPSGGQVIPGYGFWEITGLAWSGQGKITRVEVSADGGKTWQTAALQDPVFPKAHTRFRFPWTWNGEEAILMSRATDETGYVQPTKAALVAVRGTHSYYHFNGIQPWKVAADGRVANALT